MSKRNLLDDIAWLICAVLFIVNLWAKDYDHAQLWLGLLILLVVGSIRRELSRSREPERL